MNLIYEDDYFLAIDKPAGHFVHPPEKSPYPVPREHICIFYMQDFLGYRPIPVHRLDSATSGVLVFAKNRDLAEPLNNLFRTHTIRKKYWLVARGHTPEHGTIDLDLDIHGGKTLVRAQTNFQSLAKIELPFAVGKKYATSRYTWLSVEPVTGRWHQLRRHFDRIAHPIIGDIEHGDTYHNRFFRDTLEIRGLCLRCIEMSFIHPWTNKEITLQAPENESWKRIQTLFEQTDFFFAKSDS